jgi:hypothetical protein
MDPVAIVLLIAFALALIIGAKMYLNRQRARNATPLKSGVEMPAPPPRPIYMPLQDDEPRSRGKSGIDGTHSPVVLGEVLDRPERAPVDPDAPADTRGSD